MVKRIIGKNIITKHIRQFSQKKDNNADNTAITIISAPIIVEGINLPNMKITDTIPQKRAVPILVL